MAQARQPLSDPLVEQVVRRLLMLGQPTRIRILEVLKGEGEMGEGEMVVQALADALETTQQNVSRHLALLHHEGVVERRRQGRLIVVPARRRDRAATDRAGKRVRRARPASRRAPVVNRARRCQRRRTASSALAIMAQPRQSQRCSGNRPHDVYGRSATPPACG